MKVLALIHDAYGGYGGIGKFNRDLLAALASHPDIESVVAVPRIMLLTPQTPPAKVEFDRAALGGKPRYAWRCLTWLVRDRFDLVICGNINLLPFAWLWRLRGARPIVLVLHGTDAWTPPRGALAARLASRADAWIAVSAHTRDRFVSWSQADSARCHILPNSIDLERFRPGPKDPALLARYGLAGKRIVMTLGRLDGRERAKGIDQILDVLPTLIAELPDLAYLVVGEGDDRPRLQARVDAEGLAAHVVFAGYIAEAEKPAHYRLADLYAMPSRSEGFGIVFLEALACGIPVVGSRIDGGREALLDGRLGILVDPDDRAELIAAIQTGLGATRGTVPPELAQFSEAMFRKRVLKIVDLVCTRHRGRDKVPERAPHRPRGPQP